MATPVGFEGANFIFYAPESMPDCQDLATLNDGTQIISAWRLSAEELEAVARTGVVWLRIHAQGMPPVSISGTALVTVEGREAVAEPIIPKITPAQRNERHGKD